jgi:hypothetical protein
MQRLAADNDALLRTIVRLSLEKRLGGQQAADSLSVRGSRRVEWIEAALAPARPLLSSSRFERLVPGLTLCLGIEPLITKFRVWRDAVDSRLGAEVAIAEDSARQACIESDSESEFQLGNHESGFAPRSAASGPPAAGPYATAEMIHMY